MGVGNYPRPMKLRGRLAGLVLCTGLAAAPVVVSAPAQAACESLRTTAAGTASGVIVQPASFAAADEPTPTPCPGDSQLGPSSDDDGGSDTARTTAFAIAAAVLIVGGFVLRYRANRG